MGVIRRISESSYDDTGCITYNLCKQKHKLKKQKSLCYAFAGRVAV